MKTLLTLCFIVAGFAGFASTSDAATMHHHRHHMRHHRHHHRMHRHMHSASAAQKPAAEVPAAAAQ